MVALRQACCDEEADLATNALNYATNAGPSPLAHVATLNFSFEGRQSTGGSRRVDSFSYGKRGAFRHQSEKHREAAGACWQVRVSDFALWLMSSASGTGPGRASARKLALAEAGVVAPAGNATIRCTNAILPAI